ncbi:hypothetical protein [Stenotrophomonas sp. SORGH_AS_0321]|uniref:hypothetical protein n=1 Tax=Stenotrophomonas sp. SORGH_AS_0321 TaxID=3041787 RepID=UPI0028619436|nr:hypothetical protein [Stenotrophomonas sp. SORGH_AS_0321]MDR6094698.1 glutamate/tyrosine decarboxylase-like PLP-dependent enzyme [Stenotrophomonas sp. SORGH_AS_0321]
MDEDIVRAMTKYMPYNKINRNEYAFLIEVERRCIDFIASLLHAPAGDGAFGAIYESTSEQAWEIGCNEKLHGRCV